jgi:hypothetical protein
MRPLKRYVRIFRLSGSDVFNPEIIPNHGIARAKLRSFDESLCSLCVHASFRENSR